MQCKQRLNSSLKRIANEIILNYFTFTTFTFPLIPKVSNHGVRKIKQDDRIEYYQKYIISELKKLLKLTI